MPKLRCPICRSETEWEGNPHRPFCSERCKLIDLGEWAAESYRVPKSDTEPGSSPDSEGEDA